MDAYLEIAERVLSDARKPLSAKQIIEQAYTKRLVPPQLHGRTQHKTLGARLSEDILVKRERSSFFRTAPGRFFLRSLQTDNSIPENFRVPIVARRRQRELLPPKALALRQTLIDRFANRGRLDVAAILTLLKKNEYHYANTGVSRKSEEALIWSFVMVTRGTEVLTYRHGRYRENRDTFIKRRSVGFFTPVVEQDYDLFDKGDRGILSAGMKAVIIDLDFPPTHKGQDSLDTLAKLKCLLQAPAKSGYQDLLAIIQFECPTWFEPLKRRLAINDLRWMDLLTPTNNIEDFDPWSQIVLYWTHNMNTTRMHFEQDYKRPPS